MADLPNIESKNKKIRNWLIFSICLNLILIVLIIYLMSSTKKHSYTSGSGNPEGADTTYGATDSTIAKDTMTFNKNIDTEKGKCTSEKPLDGDFIKVKLYFKAKDIRLRYFLWNGFDYAGTKGCFIYNGEDTYSMESYLPSNMEKKVPFTAVIRSSANNNEVEYSIKVYDLKDKLIGQSPEGKDSEKLKIESIKNPLTISKLVSLNL